ncbi:uncharacterized protein LOC107045785 [Diachasma alloeum]|uniref:uncharacterized protein LOC107045785 n=1 Tax=Diachasma alloeum TaxID=454923 RepID=UPI0007385151|nr:uncharacterized protein LOC107045785 [Diachasma alloeum]
MEGPERFGRWLRRVPPLLFLLNLGAKRCEARHDKHDYITIIENETPIVKPVFETHSLEFEKLRGECFDGASNVSERITGLHTLIRKIEPRALFSHCDAHNVDSTVLAKAAGFLRHLESFEFYYLLTLFIELFDRIKILNTELQKTELCLLESSQKVKAVADGLKQMRDSKFDTIWKKATADAKELELDDPKLLRTRNIPRKLENSGASALHIFKEPKDYYKKVYYEIFDTLEAFAIFSVKKKKEEKAEGEEEDGNTRGEDNKWKKEVSVDGIVEFYGNDFDKDALVRDHDFFVGLVEKKQPTLESIKDVVSFLRDNPWCHELVPEYSKFIRLLLTIPNSTCTNERSLNEAPTRRLKNYLRSTMLQERLNNIAILPSTISRKFRSR